MKRGWVLVLCAALWLCCAGCSVSLPVNIDCETVTGLYDRLDYQVVHEDTPQETYSCYVKAEDGKSGEYVYFYFFADEQTAREFANENKWSLGKWFSSLFAGEPTWVQVQTIGNVVCKYDGDAIFRVLQSLGK